MRLAAFVVALLLLGGGLEPTRGPLVVLVVATGLAWLRFRPWRPIHPRPVLDLRFAAFVLAVLLLAGTVDPTRGWLIALSVITGVALVMPRMFAFGPRGGHLRRRRRWRDRARDWDWGWDWDWESDWDWDDDRDGGQSPGGRPGGRFGDGWR